MWRLATPYFSSIQSPLHNIVGLEQRKLLDQAATAPSPATDAIGLLSFDAPTLQSLIR